MKKIIYIITVLLAMSQIVFADSKDNIKKHQKDLNSLNADIEKTEKNLKNLRNKENKIQKELSNSTQKINASNKVISGLNKELRQIQNNIKGTQLELDNRTLTLEQSKRRYLGNIRQFYMMAHKTDKNIFSEDPNEEMILSRQIVYLSSLAGFESENVDIAENLLTESVDKKHDLTSDNKRMKRLRDKKTTTLSLAESTKNKQERDLIKARNKKKQEIDKMLTLKQAAEEMERLVAELQEEAIRKAQDNKSQRESFFASLKGQLLSPFKGKVIESFGDKVDKMNLHSSNPSISIKGKAGGKVTAVASGTIAYVGELRGYGNFIIINHDDRFFTTYAGLGTIVVEKDNYILAGNKIATSGTEGILRFEIRDKRTPVDPVEWIQFESFR